MQLREWRAADAEAVARYAANPRIAAWLRDAFPQPYTRADAEWYIRDCIEREGKTQHCRAITQDGKAIGSIGVFFQTDIAARSAELGYWLGEPYWGKGIMTAAVQELCALVFSSTDIVRIYAEPFADNVASRRVLEKAGFVLEGILRKSVCKNGVFHDACMYALVR